MGFIATGSNKEFKPVPEGTHMARCYRLIDLGTQEEKNMQTGEMMLRSKIYIGWELFGEDDDGKPLATSDGKPFTTGKTYTLSLGKKANLRADLESWRGTAFTDADLKGFDVSKLLGAYCMLGIKHTKKEDKTYANISSVSRWPAALKNSKPEPFNPPELFDISKPDLDVYEALPQWLQEKINEAVESNGKSAATASPSKGHADADIPDDDCPF